MSEEQAGDEDREASLNPSKWKRARDEGELNPIYPKQKLYLFGTKSVHNLYQISTGFVPFLF
jgi:hypothetical protein